jgi:hypothetical protein
MKFSTVIVTLVAAAPVASAFTTPTFGVNQGSATKSTKAIQPLNGILDEVNSDAFDLLGGSSSGDDDKIPNNIADAYEAFLAQLIFSTNDPRMDIVENIDLASDPKWLGWLSNKVDTCGDVEEKMALRDLKEMVEDIVKRIELSKAAEERAEAERVQAEQERVAQAEADAESGRSLSDADVLRKAGAVDRAGVDAVIEEEGGSKKKSFYDTELTPEIRMSYDDMCKKVLPPYKPGDSPASIVFSFYDQFDAQFIKILKERSDNGESEAQDVLDALGVEQNKRMAAATETVKEVLAAGDPMRMEGKIVAFAKEGRIDEPFLLLLEANANQAAAAGATGPAELMKRLANRAMEEKDKQTSTKEIKLLRKLLRTDETSEREAILEDAFTPRAALLVEGSAANMNNAVDGEAPDEEKPVPDVPPPDFINACKAVLLNFGNLSSDDERGDLSSRIRQIAAEAEAVATRIYGQGMSLREQQDRAWKEQSTSIFDLETLEIEAERMGETAPWANENGDDILPGFDVDGKMKIGGS